MKNHQSLIFLLTRLHCFCLSSIFRMFSADRKRVETALENCNLPSGRVGSIYTIETILDRSTCAFMQYCFLYFCITSTPSSLLLCQNKWTQWEQ